MLSHLRNLTYIFNLHKLLTVGLHAITLTFDISSPLLLSPPFTIFPLSNHTVQLAVLRLFKNRDISGFCSAGLIQKNTYKTLFLQFPILFRPHNVSVINISIESRRTRGKRLYIMLIEEIHSTNVCGSRWPPFMFNTVYNYL